jgi:hypothetical protein
MASVLYLSAGTPSRHVLGSYGSCAADVSQWKGHWGWEQ